MDLISLQNSWDEIDSTIKNNYDTPSTEIPYLNFKKFLFKNSPKKIIYVDSIDNNDCILFLLDGDLETGHVTIVLKNTISTIGNLFNPTGHLSTATIVFKHNLTEFQTLLNNTNIIRSFSRLLKAGINYVVPTGLKNDYINALNQQGYTYWDNLTEEQKSALITEGSEEY